MTDLIQHHREQINRLCRQYKVRRLEVFGSAAGAGFEPKHSDVDFLVEFLPLGENEHADMYFGLLESLESLLGRPVDLVMAAALSNPYFIQAIADSRTELYAA